jgi:hypothetical protein
LEKHFFGDGGSLFIGDLNLGLHHLPHLPIDWLDICCHLSLPIRTIGAIKLGWLLGVVDLSHFDTEGC